MDAPVRLTVKDEIAAMRQRRSQFRVVAASDAIVIWRGTLAPIRQAYDIRILYGPKFFLGRLRLRNHQPRVEVISPPLVDRHPVTGKPVQHVYPNESNPESPLLCLYDPATDEWRPGKMAIADSIVPWTAHWLACYEGWLATGFWTGGGRHPTSRFAETGTDKLRSTANNTDPPRQRRLAGKVADVIGTHASRAILAHATSEPRDCLDTVEMQFIYQELAKASLVQPGVAASDNQEPFTSARDAA